MRVFKFIVVLALILFPGVALSQPHPDIPLDQKQWYGIGEVGHQNSLYPYPGGIDFFTYFCGGIDENGAIDNVCVNQYTDACELIVSAPAAGLNVTIIGPLGTRPAAQSVSTAPPTDAYYMVSRTAAANAIANVLYTGISDGTNLATVETDLAFGRPTTTNSLDVSAYQYGYNGATFDPLLTGAVGELLTTDVATRPGEDAANDWRKVKKEAIGVYAPIKETSGSIGTAAVTVIAPKEILGYPNCTIYLKNNDAADPFVDVQLLVSADAVSYTELTWTTCNTLGFSQMCVYQLSNQSYRYLAVLVNATDANPVSTVDAWITCNVD
jgi:hypothetical protein